ncbi:MAG TPA: sulfatase [Candidatus Polarisedimenticolia bacterium]|jgi:arylsulfatase A-like enzyme
MKAGRAPLHLLNLSIALAAAAALYVWLAGPIDAVLRVRPIHWDTPARPLRLAAGLFVLRLLAPWIAAMWRRVAGPLLSALKRPYVWAPLLALALAWWPISRHRSYLEAIRSAGAARDSGHAQIGLVTRPVLDDLEVIEGVPLPAGASGRRIEISCGLAPGAAGRLQIPEGAIAGRVMVGPPAESSGANSRRLIGACPIEPGAWHTVTVTLPPDIAVRDRLLVETPGRPGERAAPFVWWSRPELLPSPDPARPNLLLISLDTLRADHLGAYGYRRPVSPNIDRLAREGTLFERALAQAPWTTPSHMTLFTSLFPSVHAVDAPTTNRQRRLADDKRVLAEILHDAGYATAAFTGSGAISALYGFWRGFSVYDETDHDDPARGGEDISGVFEGASRWLVDHHDRPFFMFFHSYEVHGPYIHQAFAGEATVGDETQKVTALYDGDILYADGFIGQLISLLDGLGVKQRTIIVLLSDHGEELQARYPGKRIGHGHTVYDELLHVPLIFVAPGRVSPGARVRQMVQTIDVMPTLLEMLGLPAPPGIQGVSFARVFRGEPIVERHAFAEATNNGPERKTLRDGRYKYIKVFPRTDRTAREIPVPIPEEEFFDLETDPEERRSIMELGGPALDELRRQLSAIVALNMSRRSQAPEQVLDEETIRRLKALGYIQ